MIGLASIALASCGHSLETGEWGTYRFIGRVKGQAPLNVLPPVSDRNANIYTLYGAIGVTEVSAFISRAAGGSAQVCNLTKSDVYGAHGWVGFADDRAWYWSGDWLVAVPSAGPCTPVLPEDPHTNVELQFRAVVPWVRVTPTRSSLVALIKSPTDIVPYAAMVDLARNVATNVAALPIAAEAVSVLGTGEDHQNEEGVVLIAVTQGGTTRMQALFFDEQANLIATSSVRGAPPPEYGVVGNLQFRSDGTVVGLTSLGSLVVFDRDGGAIVDVDKSVQPVGVHRWGDDVWLVGISGGRPVVCPIEDTGRPGPCTDWDASKSAGAALGGALEVSDDRSFPARPTKWATVRSAIGTAPFLSPHSPWPHAPDTTLWVIAGPELDANGLPTTSIAVAPVGIRYP